METDEDRDMIKDREGRGERKIMERKLYRKKNAEGRNVETEKNETDVKKQSLMKVRINGRKRMNKGGKIKRQKRQKKNNNVGETETER